MKKLALTYGDLNGVGVEILIKALNFLNLSVDDVVIVGSKKVFDFYSKNYNLNLDKNYEIIDVPLEDNAFSVGEENEQSGEHCFLVLKNWLFFCCCDCKNNMLFYLVNTLKAHFHPVRSPGFLSY